MSIAPPSDIILDVAQAADPTKRDAAVARLAKLGGTDPNDFTAALQQPSSPLVALSPIKASPTVDIGTHGAPQHASRALSPYQKFEAVLLQNFLQDTLPKDDELFGDAASADTMRSMLAEQIANQLAARGSFGIAKMIEKHEKSPVKSAIPGNTLDLGASNGLHASTGMGSFGIRRG